MNALSLWQPWASLVGRGKSVETRSWYTSYRGPLAIHAAQRWTPEEVQVCLSEPFAHVLEEQNLIVHGVGDTKQKNHLFESREHRLPLGAIVAVATLVDCIPTERILVEGNNKGNPFVDPSGYGHIGYQEECFGDYEQGRYGWFFGEIYLLPEPIPCKGNRQIFTVDLPQLAALYPPRQGVLL